MCHDTPPYHDSPFTMTYCMPCARKTGWDAVGCPVGGMGTWAGTEALQLIKILPMRAFSLRRKMVARRNRGRGLRAGPLWLLEEFSVKCICVMLRDKGAPSLWPQNLRRSQKQVGKLPQILLFLAHPPGSILTWSRPGLYPSCLPPHLGSPPEAPHHCPRIPLLTDRNDSTPSGPGVFRACLSSSLDLPNAPCHECPCGPQLSSCEFL